jgi:biopolymer transport protein ExbD
MKYVLEVCLIAFTAASTAPPTAAQSPALQKGVSVELAPTHNALPMLDADSEDAFVVAVTAKGSVYLGADLISVPELAERVRSTPLRRGQAIYIKADGRSPYGTVLPVLQATHNPGIAPQVLLTGQSESTPAGSIVSPKGLDVSVGSTLPVGTVATVVQLLPSGQERPLLKINDEQVSWAALASTLLRHFQKGDDKIVLLRTDLRLPFGDIVHAIDSCRAAGARVYLADAAL